MAVESASSKAEEANEWERLRDEFGDEEGSSLAVGAEGDGRRRLASDAAEGSRRSMLDICRLILGQFCRFRSIEFYRSSESSTSSARQPLHLELQRKAAEAPCCSPPFL